MKLIAALFPNRHCTLRQHIYAHYMRSALIPILIIEVGLLLVYFFMSWYFTSTQISYLRQNALTVLNQESSLQSNILINAFHDINDNILMLQTQMQDIYEHPAKYSLNNAPPLQASNGCWLKSVDNGGAVVFISGIVPLNEALRQEYARTEYIDLLMRQIQSTHPNIIGLYFNSQYSMCRYYPFIDVMRIFTPQMDIPRFNFYYAADATHNPSRKIVWLPPYLDPAGAGWVSSCIAPVYSQQSLVGVVGIDISIKGFINLINSFQVSNDGFAVLLSDDGKILAMPEKGEKLFNLELPKEFEYSTHVLQDTDYPPEFNINTTSNDGLKALSSRITEAHQDFVISVGTQEVLVNYHKIANTSFSLLTMVPTESIFAPTRALEQKVRSIGYIAIIGMIIFYILFFYMLSRRARSLSLQFTDPINRLSEVVAEIGQGNLSVAVPASNNDEIDRLAKAIAKMQHDLQQSKLNEALHLANLSETVEKLNKLTDDLQRANRLKDDFIANMSHEIRTPLAAIIGYISLLKDNIAALDEESQENINIIASNAEQLLRLINDVLDTLLIEDGFHSDIQQVINIYDIVEGLVYQPRYVSESQAKNIIVELAIARNDEVLVTGGDLRKIVGYLIDNAFKFTLSGKITVTGQLLSNDWYKLEIADSGIGVSPTDYENIFEKFVQLDGSRQRQFGGVGLGLYLAKRFIEMMGGSITVTGNENAPGSIFTLCFPTQKFD